MELFHYRAWRAIEARALVGSKQAQRSLVEGYRRGKSIGRSTHAERRQRKTGVIHNGKGGRASVAERPRGPRDRPGEILSLSGARQYAPLRVSLRVHLKRAGQLLSRLSAHDRLGRSETEAGIQYAATLPTR